MSSDEEKKKHQDIFRDTATDNSWYVIAHGSYNPVCISTSTKIDSSLQYESSDDSVINKLSTLAGLGKINDYHFQDNEFSLGEHTGFQTSLQCTTISHGEYHGSFGDDGTADSDPALFKLKKNQFIYGIVPNVSTLVQPNVSEEANDIFFSGKTREKIIDLILNNKVKVVTETDSEQEVPLPSIYQRPCLYTPGNIVPNINISTKVDNVLI